MCDCVTVNPEVPIIDNSRYRYRRDLEDAITIAILRAISLNADGI